PETTDDERDYKRSLAKAYIAVEFIAHLSGEATDYDRHGDQMRVEGYKVGLFDHGAKALEPPTEAEKIQFAKVFFKGISMAMTQDMAFTDQPAMPLTRMSTFLREEIIRIEKETGTTPENLVRVESSLLNMGDFIRQITPTDFTDILKIVAQ